MQVAGVIFDLSASDAMGRPVHTFSPPLTLTVHYADADLPVGTDEESLDLYRWDEDSGQWVALTVLQRDTVTNTLTVALDHLTEFALLASEDRRVYLPLVMRNFQ
jgi:hypothetical protein